MYVMGDQQVVDLEIAINNAHVEWLREHITVEDGYVFYEGEDGYVDCLGSVDKYFGDESATLCDVLDLPHLSLSEVEGYEYDTVPHAIDYEAEDYE